MVTEQLMPHSDGANQRHHSTTSGRARQAKKALVSIFLLFPPWPAGGGLPVPLRRGWHLSWSGSASLNPKYAHGRSREWVIALRKRGFREVFAKSRVSLPIVFVLQRVRDGFACFSASAWCEKRVFSDFLAFRQDFADKAYPVFLQDVIVISWAWPTGLGNRLDALVRNRPQPLVAQGVEAEKPPRRLNAPLNAAVESDVVGYTTMTMEAGKWYQVGCPFGQLDGSKIFSVNDVFSRGFKTGDSINIFDSEKGSYSVLSWSDSLNAWTDFPGAPFASTAQLTEGQAIFVSKAVTSEITLSGKVSEVVVSFGKEGGNAWNQIVAVWPVASKVNDLKWSGLQTGDILNVLNADSGTYEVFYWDENVGGGKWVVAPGVPLPSDKAIAPGQALFVNKVSAGLGSLTK